MTDTQDTQIRDSIIRSLSAIGAVDEARFYAEYFASMEPQCFALFIIDPRCLNKPLLETLIGNIRILSDLDLYPSLLIGALDGDMTNVKFLTQRLLSELEHAKVRAMRLNTASYELMSLLAQTASKRMVPILEQTRPQNLENLSALIRGISPSKVIFLQPSGGLSQKGERVAVINVDREQAPELDPLTPGQKRFMDVATTLSRQDGSSSVYVIASPLNLMGELFTTKGSGTMIRRGAAITKHDGLKDIDLPRLWQSISDGFDRALDPSFSRRPIEQVFLDKDYRGGAIITRLADLPYLSKFWVSRAARGEGLARDVWDVMLSEVDAVFWRSRRDNPFNDWYLKHCEGMHVAGEWRVFWRGLSMREIPYAIVAATDAPIDFSPL